MIATKEIDTGLDKRPSGGQVKHGLTMLKHAVKGLGGRVIDRRTTLGKSLDQWRSELIKDLGGDVSVQQAAIIDLAVRSKLMLDSIDAWILTQDSLINKKKKTLIPVVKERTQLADSLAKYLSMLGLERIPKELNLKELLNEETDKPA